MKMMIFCLIGLFLSFSTIAYHDDIAAWEKAAGYPLGMNCDYPPASWNPNCGGFKK